MKAIDSLLPKSVLAQILAGIALVIMIFGLTVLATHAVFENTLYMESQNRQGRQQALFLAKLSGLALYTENEIHIEAPLAALMNRPEVNGIALYRTDGSLWIKREKSGVASSVISPEEAMTFLLSDGEGNQLVVEHEKNIDFFASVKMTSFMEFDPAKYTEEEIIGLAQVVISRSYFDSILLKLRLVDILGVIMASIMALIAGFILARRIASPIHKLNESAQRVADGDLSEVDTAGATGEFAQLIVSFNQMLTSLQEREKLMIELRQAQKMEAIGTLAGGIAHDFNNILSAILGYTQLAMIDTEKGSTLHKNLNQVLKASERAKELVAQILTFSRQSITEQNPILIGPVIQEVLKLLRASLPSGIDIQQDIQKSTGTVLADPVQIHQVIMNLCTNAYQAMGEKGVIVVNLKEIDIDETRAASVPGLNPGLYQHLEVKDRGPGMEKAILERVFEPFFTTKQKGKGTGMGLALVHGIITECNGAIQVDSKVGEGTVFELYFPIVDGVAGTDTPDSYVFAQGDNRHILLVDDETALVQLGQQMLEHLGYKVTGRTSSNEALALFIDLSAEFDVVITDQTMPEFSGSELARKIRAIRPDIPIILYTGFSSTLSEEVIEECGITRLIMKPLTMQKLSQVLEEVRHA